MMKYHHAKDDEWIRPVRSGYKMACCDCGLVHKIDFKHVPYGRGRKIIFRAARDERATAAVRREKTKKVKGKSTLIERRLMKIIQEKIPKGFIGFLTIRKNLAVGQPGSPPALGAGE